MWKTFPVHGTQYYMAHWDLLWLASDIFCLLVESEDHAMLE